MLELTKDTFDREVLQAPVPVLVDFYAPNCGPCRMQAPVIKELAGEVGERFRVATINAWAELDVATRFRISAVPALLIFKDGEVVRSLVGYHDKAKLLEALRAA